LAFRPYNDPMIFLIKRYAILFSFLFGEQCFALNIKEELSNLNIDDQVLLRGADFSDSLLSFANGSDRPLNLTPQDKKTLQLLGYSDQEIDELSIGSFVDKEGRKKLSDRITNYGNSKTGEVDRGIQKSLVPGLSSSVVGLSLASLLGITVGVRCSSQPSALAFAGASAAWVGLEMMIWKGYQIEMSDIEALGEIGKIPNALKKKVERVKTILKEIERDFKISDVKDINLFLDSKQGEVDELKGVADELHGFLRKAKDKQFGALSSIQKSIELAAETSKKKARNAKVAAIGFTAAAGVAAMEAFNIFGGSGNCFTKGVMTRPQGSTSSKDFLAVVSSLFFKEAYAGFASVGDLDKIGIPVGAGLAAAYLGFEKKFADKIYASGTSRSVIFVGMAGLAYFASKKLDEASEFLDKQAQEMKLFVDSLESLTEGKMTSFPSGQALINSLKNDLLPSLEDLVKDSIDTDKIKEDLAGLGKDIGASTKEELEGLAKEEIEKLNDKAILEELESFGRSKKDMIEFEADEFLNRASYGPTLIDQILSSLVSEAYASKVESSLKIKPSCFYRTKTFLKMNESCSCAKTGNCSRTLFPTSLKASAKAKSFAGLYQFALKADQANNLIMTGRADKGIQIYKGLYSKVAQVDGMTRSMISKKISKPLSIGVSAMISGSMMRSTGPALTDYFKERKLQKAPIEQASKSGLLAKEVGRKQAKQNRLKERIQKHLILAKALDNPRLQNFDLASANFEGSSLEYDYSKESIVKDKSKNIFNIIKKLYLIILRDGRL